MHVKWPRLMRALVVVPLLLGIALLGACGDDDDDDGAADLAIQGVDFGFEGIPESVSAGKHTISFENRGGEFHEMIMLKLPEGLTLEQALELPDEESDEFFNEGVVGILLTLPGSTANGSLTAELTAGTYALLCFIENDNGPHAFQGMVADFTVE